MQKTIEIWSDGTTGGFTISVHGRATYFRTYETAHAALLGLGMLSQPAAVALDNALRRVTK